MRSLFKNYNIGKSEEEANGSEHQRDGKKDLDVEVKILNEALLKAANKEI